MSSQRVNRPEPCIPLAQYRDAGSGRRPCVQNATQLDLFGHHLALQRCHALNVKALQGSAPKQPVIEESIAHLPRRLLLQLPRPHWPRRPSPPRSQQRLRLSQPHSLRRPRLSGKNNACTQGVAAAQRSFDLRKQSDPRNPAFGDQNYTTLALLVLTACDLQCAPNVHPQGLDVRGAYGHSRVLAEDQTEWTVHTSSSGGCGGSGCTGRRGRGCTYSTVPR